MNGGRHQVRDRKDEDRVIRDDAAGYLRAQDNHDLGEFILVDSPAVVIVTGIEELVDGVPAGWKASRRADVLGQVQMYQNQASIEFRLVDFTRLIAITHSEGPFREFSECLGPRPERRVLSLLQVIVRAAGDVRTAAAASGFW